MIYWKQMYKKPLNYSENYCSQYCSELILYRRSLNELHFQYFQCLQSIFFHVLKVQHSSHDM